MAKADIITILVSLAPFLGVIWKKILKPSRDRHVSLFPLYSRDLSVKTPFINIIGTFIVIIIFSVTILIFIPSTDSYEEFTKNGIILRIISLGLLIIHSTYISFKPADKITKSTRNRFRFGASIYVTTVFSTIFISAYLDLIQANKFLIFNLIDGRIILGVIMFIVITYLLYLYQGLIDFALITIAKKQNIFVVFYDEGKRKIVCNDIHDFRDRYLLLIDVCDSNKKKFKKTCYHTIAIKKEITNDILFIEKF